MKTITFVTGNTYKFEVAKKVLGKVGIKVVQQKLDTPEIQNIDVSEVSVFSAKWAANKLNTAVVVTDTGYYIEALNGFPGPFVKFINKWLTAEDLILLMKGKTNRKTEVRISISFCQPGKEPVTFLTVANGTIATKAGKASEKEFPMNQIFIPEGFDKVDCEISRDEMVKFWMEKETYWEKLAKYLLA